MRPRKTSNIEEPVLCESSNQMMGGTVPTGPCTRVVTGRRGDQCHPSDAGTGAVDYCQAQAGWVMMDPHVEAVCGDNQPRQTNPERSDGMAPSPHFVRG